MKTFAALLILVSLSLGQRNSRNFLQGKMPFLETYWESYMTFKNRPESCLNLSIGTTDDYGTDLKDIPDEVNIVRIAFGDSNAGYHCTFFNGPQAPCEPYVCGIHLYDVGGVDRDRFTQLKDDISELQSRGKLVLLSYGGEEHGNIRSEKFVRYLDALVNEMVEAVIKLGLDGIDIANEIGGGTDQWEHGDEQTAHQLYVLKL